MEGTAEMLVTPPFEVPVLPSLACPPWDRVPLVVIPPLKLVVGYGASQLPKQSIALFLTSPPFARI